MHLGQNPLDEMFPAFPIAKVWFMLNNSGALSVLVGVALRLWSRGGYYRSGDQQTLSELCDDVDPEPET